MSPTHHLSRTPRCGLSMLACTMRAALLAPVFAALFAGCTDEPPPTGPEASRDSKSLGGPRSTVATATITNAAQQVFQAPDAQAFAAFGWSVAGVAEKILVGAPFHAVDGANNAGQAYLLAQDGTLLHTFQAPDAEVGNPPHFGYSVAGVGENVLVGAPFGGFSFGKAYLFAQDGTLLQTFQAPDVPFGSYGFGWSVAGIGEKVLVGAPFFVSPDGGVDAGQAYLFAQDGTLLHTFRAPDVRPGRAFGLSVAGVGENVLVGAPDRGSGEGKAYLFAQDGTLLQTIQDPDAQAFANFGWSVAGVGEKVLVGAVSAGKAYLFAQDGTVLQTFRAPDAQPGTAFGHSVAGVGENVLVDEPLNLGGLGKAYLFAQDGTLLQTFQAPDAQAEAVLGGSVAGLGEKVLVGAPGHTVDGLTSAGKAYLFGLPLNQAPIASTGGPYDGNEGASVAFDGTGSSDPDGDPLAFDWDFGDGSDHSSGATPSHTYADNGTYTVTLNVDDGHGGIRVATTTATVSNVAPEVNAGTASSVQSGLTLDFSGDVTDAGVADTPSSWTLDWGDGTTPLGGNSAIPGSVSATHTYFGIGSFTLQLTVTDKDGGVGTASRTVTVDPRSVTVRASPDAVSLSAKRAKAIDIIIFSAPGLDATQIDPATLSAGDGNDPDALPVQRRNGAYVLSMRDVNRDGLRDLAFSVEKLNLDLGLAAPSTTLVVRGAIPISLGPIVLRGSVTIAVSP